MSIFALDNGTLEQFVTTWLGPSLGWAKLPVMPELFVSSTAPLTIPPFTSRVILNAAVTSILLPSVAAWVTPQPTLGQRNIACFDRSLWIKDLIGAASVGSPIVVTACGSDEIDTLSSYSIITAYDLIRLYPLSDLSGWYVG
jgi:hypothetical protein